MSAEPFSQYEYAAQEFAHSVEQLEDTYHRRHWAVPISGDSTAKWANPYVEWPQP